MGAPCRRRRCAGRRAGRPRPCPGGGRHDAVAARRGHRRAGVGQDPRAHAAHRLPSRHRHRRRPPHRGAHVHPRGGRRAAPPLAAQRRARATSRPARSTPSPSGCCGSAGSTSTSDRRRSSATATACSPRSPVVSRSRCWQARSSGRRRGASRPTATWPQPAPPGGGRRPPPEQIAERLAAYEQLKRRRGVVDLDDLLAMAARQLAEDPSWAEVVRWRYRHVLVDEAQDLNPLQHRLLELRGRRARRPVPRRRPGAGDLRLQRRRPHAAHRRGRPAAAVSRSSTCRPTTARRRRSSPPASTSCAAAGSARTPCPRGATAPRCGWSPPTTRSTRRRSSPRSSAPPTRPCCAAGTWPCWPAPTPS